MNLNQSFRTGRIAEIFVVNSDPSQRHKMKRFSVQGFFKCLTTCSFCDSSKFPSKVSLKMWIHTAFLEKVGQEFSNEDIKKEASLTNPLILLLKHFKTSFYTDGNLRSVLPFWHRTLCLKVVFCGKQVKLKTLKCLLFHSYQKTQKLDFRNAKSLITNKHYIEYMLTATYGITEFQEERTMS